MENTDTTADDSFDSVPQPSYEAFEEEDNIQNTNSSLTMESEDILNNSYLEEEEDEEDDDEANDTDVKIKNYSKHTTSSHNRKKDNTLSNDPEDDEDEDEEEYSPDFEVEGDMLEDNPQSYIENVTPEKHDPLNVPDRDVMVKKIKIYTNKNFNPTKIDNLKQQPSQKTRKLQTSLTADINKTLQPQQLQQPRSSTPMSREYLALQRSVNESKILTEFVTETANEKPRKLRIKDSANTSTSSNTDHSYSSVRKSNISNTQLTPEKGYEDGTNNISPSSQAKRQYSKRYAPLKYAESDVDPSSNLPPRSRSKSMHNSEFALTGSDKNLKKWPSEERLHKRTNMRSENSEFVQKQLDFLQRVIHSCETPRSRSRSRSKSTGRSISGGRKSPSSVADSVGGVGGVVVTEGSITGVGNQQKPQKNVSSKERTSKRSKHETGIEHDDLQLPQLSQVSLVEPMEHPDDVSVNESNTSMMGGSAIVDSSMADGDNLNAEMKALWQPPPKHGSDSFCWKCHESSVNLCCSKCIRSFHAACAKMYKLDNSWICPECATVDNMLNNHKRSRRHELSLDLLSQLLSFALKRMRYAKGHYNFLMPYEETTIDNKFIINPVTLTKLQSKIEMKQYRCAEELVNETKWMLHNANILSSGSSTKTVMAAKAIFKICRQEANEIETCPECYLNANTRTDWFVDVCSQPHLLLWAKLKGFPYWPAKAMGLGQNSLVNVRFFGEHDRAFVPMKDCFLYSEQDPNTATGKRAAKELADCIKEVQEHIEKIRAKVGAFKYAAFKTPYDLSDEMKQLEEMMPGVQEFIKKQHILNIKPSLQFKIYKTADNHLSIVHKASTTPELQPQITMHDNEDKKKKLSSFSEGDDCKKLEDFHASTPKYEVISKVSTDDSHSSKLGTVILKRKSVNGDSKKLAEDEPVELPLPKMTKIEDHLLEVEENNASLKRKSETHSTDKTKSKHGKTEPKLPVLTIKTSNIKDATVIKTNEVNKITLEVTTKEVAALKQPQPQPPTQQTEYIDSLATQKVVENLVKNKQGVTIKKISKEVANSNSPEQSKTNNVKDSETSPTKSVDSPKDKVAKQKAEEEKARENQKVNNILKGLVPFVEVKKEVLSDNEQEREKEHNEIAPNTEAITTEPNDIAQSSNKNVSNEDTLNNNPDSINTADKEDATPLITQVKQEIISDEEESNPTVNTNTQNINSFGTSVEKPNANVSNTTEVRMVGDTTIQKLSCRNFQNPYALPNTRSAASNIGGSVSSKRVALRGVPYGPLPASAFPKSIASKTIVKNDLAIQPRAKKTFPQHSPPLEKLRSAVVNQNTPAQIISNSTSTTNSHLDPKKSMAKTTMVAIPVDVASNRATTSIGSIPVPPLTAVSKTVPHFSASFNSLPRNSPATTTVSAALGSLSTVSAMNETKTSASLTLTTTATHTPITVSAYSSLSAPLSSQQVSLKNPLTLSAPPPLAGLSGSILSTTQQNGLTDLSVATTTPVISATPATPATTATSLVSSSVTPQSSSTDTHLLGGLVTPSLASAITDVICRGPPKLAVRPSGPLQSEGHPLFPSQAGPVCKRLVENVHKLTDFFISVVEDTMGEMAQGDDASLQAKITLLTMELERSKQSYEQEITELKRTSDLMLCEMSKSMENEKTRLAIEIRKQCELERIRSIEETKRKQWCANCFREANFYCCWNTSYCDYPCQQLHWPRHAHSCAQTRPCGSDLTKAVTATTGSLNNLNHQERHHATKSICSTNTSANFNKSTSTTISHKKEKGAVSKNSSNQMMPSSMPTAVTTSTTRTNTEVLKLPSNTYLRPVTSTLNNQTLRCNTTYSIPVQRFNVPSCFRPNSFKVNAKQREVMAMFMVDHPKLAKNISPCGGLGKVTKNRLWEQLTIKLNAYGPPCKDSKSWRKVFADQKLNVKRKISRNEASKQKSVGGCFQKIFLTSTEEQIIQASGIDVSGIALKSLDSQKAPIDRVTDVKKIINIQSFFQDEEMPLTKNSEKRIETT